MGLPTEFLADCSFNDDPMPLRISGVREMNRNLFEMLSRASDLLDAGEAFTCYMMAIFGLDPEQRETRPVPAKGRRYRSSFLRLIKGWGFDNNGPEGEVLGLGRKPLRHFSDLSQTDYTANFQRRLDDLCGRENVEPFPQ